MRFVADEGIDFQIVNLLRANGHDVLYIVEFAPGSLDDVILKLANEEDRILMTRDKDFGELVFRDKMIHSGIILNRLYELSSENKARLILRVIEDFQEQLIGAFTVIQPNKIRLRKL
jgi:predicted nuclease of predicted toxin-antitoxin system